MEHNSSPPLALSPESYQTAKSCVDMKRRDVCLGYQIKPTGDSDRKGERNKRHTTRRLGERKSALTPFLQRVRTPVLSVYTPGRQVDHIHWHSVFLWLLPLGFWWAPLCWAVSFRSFSFLFLSIYQIETPVWKDEVSLVLKVHEQWLLGRIVLLARKKQTNLLR